MEFQFQDVDLSPVFDCLKTADPNVVKTASDILQHLLNLSDPALVLDRLETHMKRSSTVSNWIPPFLQVRLPDAGGPHLRGGGQRGAAGAQAAQAVRN